MTRRSFSDVDAVARADERCAVTALAEKRAGQIAAQADAGRIGREEADFAARQVRAFAQDVMTGLHRDGADGPKLREALRRMVAQADARDARDARERRNR
ncbi:hypothetical protein [Stakelama tenebrarum]|uniref:Uncharacterized protein n=1 Tax=Stakelama tenebrarum TaxID=2711215 RepID=A0A6G6Y4Y9_9SPHN|nr:hypothetical protein [Sphingosinithalassobacter tenebrarum]QIG79970.1 hypothetical protein G5C33_09410 [Sphingosinithalassobacter tenebrarum]